MKARFAKILVAGEDYAVMDAVTQRVYVSPVTVQRLADRKRGIGFRSLALIEPPYDPELDFHLRIYDVRGNESRDCFDAAAACAVYAVQKSLAFGTELGFSSLWGRIRAAGGAGGTVDLWADPPDFAPAAVPFRAQSAEKIYILQSQGRNVLCSAMRFGTPFCAAESVDAGGDSAGAAGEGSSEADRLCAGLAAHERFPEGCAACMYEIASRDQVRLTGLSGAGIGVAAAAAALAGISRGLLDPAPQVRLGDQLLRVSWGGGSGKICCQVPVTPVFDGEVEL